MRKWTSIALCAAALTATPLFAASRGTLLSFDFEGASAWPQKATAGAGTIDVEHGTVGSNALVLTSDGKRVTMLESGPLAVNNAEANFNKLTLGFMLSASVARPVHVHIASFDANKRRTGSLIGTVYPAAPNFYQRYALDLPAMEYDGGVFNPEDPFVSISFELRAADAWPAGAKLSVDNVHYARPAYYVRPDGDDANDGLTEQTAFATPQKAVDLSQAGDVILLMDGTWESGKSHMGIAHGGSPAAWITIKNYPGEHPKLLNETWNCVVVGIGQKESIQTTPGIGYVEMRGLHIRGIADVADKKYPELIDKSDAKTNGNAMSVEGRFETHVPHHIRFADNLCEYNCGAGPNAIEGDWITIENNRSINNVWWMIFAGSGISVMGAANFNASDGGYKMLVRDNYVFGNHCNLKWKALGRYSDGNGIICDVNKRSDWHKGEHKLGRTLVQGNVCVANGGSGIHTVEADNVDIVNNTAYLNSDSPHLQYPQIYSYGSTGVRILNNVLVAPVADVAAGEKPEPVNTSKLSPDVVYANNIYFGGNVAPTVGENDCVADPMFVAPSTQPATADFRLKPGSSAIGAGLARSFAPIRDHAGKPLPTTGPVDAGAYQH